VTFGSASNGTPQHLGGELFKARADVEISHIPYKGAGPAIVDLMGGQITSMFDILGSSIQHIKSGKLRPLAVTTRSRSALLPDVPAISELGYPDFEYYAWHGISTTAGTPKAVVTRLNTELRGIFSDPSFKEKWQEMGSEVVSGTPEQFDSFIRSEARKMETLIKGQEDPARLISRTFSVRVQGLLAHQQELALRSKTKRWYSELNWALAIDG